MLPLPKEGEDENRPPTAVELCATYAYRRGFMTHKGIPDGSRAARLILKDYVKGKLLYCYPPPGYNSEEFQQYSNRYNVDNDNNDDDTNVETNNQEISSSETTSKVYFILFTKKKKKKTFVLYFSNFFQQPRFQPSDVDQQFFHPTDVRFGTKGTHGRINYTRKSGPILAGETMNDSTNQYPDGKPWKKHHNHNKKEKLRRLYRHLDA
ncbi:unnamed protein product [Rotaria sp. Silwood2]|nr:unnamed protein product [Rotaria sp. Silwood2]